jgi:hypothetical protein
MGPITELGLQNWHHQGNTKKKHYYQGKLKNLEQST